MTSLPLRVSLQSATGQTVFRYVPPYAPVTAVSTLLTVFIMSFFTDFGTVVLGENQTNCKVTSVYLY